MVDSPPDFDDPETWNRVLRAVGPATMLFLIEERLGTKLRQLVTPEDVWQETLLHAWRDRSACEWRGPIAFRRWLLSVAENRIRDLAERVQARKRGRDVATLRFADLARSSGTTGSTGGDPVPIASTTPSRVASDAERARIMRTVLDSLPEETACLLRLRLFEGHTLRDVAEQLGIGLSAAKHRQRRAAELYHARLGQALGGTTFGIVEKP